MYAPPHPCQRTSAIFADDFELRAERPLVEYALLLRPHYSFAAHANLDAVSLHLVVRQAPPQASPPQASPLPGKPAPRQARSQASPLPGKVVVRQYCGYPRRALKLRVEAREGLEQEDVVELVALLHDQAARAAREGRVTVFNLAETAQEFLSRRLSSLSPATHHPLAPTQAGSDGEEAEGEAAGGEEGWAWEDSVDAGLFSDPLSALPLAPLPGPLAQALQAQAGAGAEAGAQAGAEARGAVRRAELGRARWGVEGEGKEEERVQEEEGASVAGQGERGQAQKLGREGVERRGGGEEGHSGVGGRTNPASERGAQEHAGAGRGGAAGGHQRSTARHRGSGAGARSRTVVAHLLRMVTSHNGPLPHALPALASQLQALEVIPQWVADLLHHDPRLIDRAFHRVFSKPARRLTAHAHADPSVSFPAMPSVLCVRSCMAPALPVARAWDLTGHARGAAVLSRHSHTHRLRGGRHAGWVRPCQRVGEAMPAGWVRPCMLVGEAMPCWVGEAMPCWVGEAMPCWVGEAMPCWVGEAMPCWVGEAMPCWVGEAMPCWVGEAMPCWVGEAMPCWVGEAMPCWVGEAMPCWVGEAMPCWVGKGGFGSVVLCVNKLDGRKYAIKRIPLRGKSPALNSKILREVATLSRLQHQHVVRYYQAWFETGAGRSTRHLPAHTDTDSMEGSASPTASTSLASASEWLTRDADLTHSHSLPGGRDGRNGGVGGEGGGRGGGGWRVAWRVVRQVVEGLLHVHGQGIIHRDLTPNNLFVQVLGAGGGGRCCRRWRKSRKGIESEGGAERGGREGGPMGERRQSATGQVGTYFYTAPEVEQGWAHVDDKASGHVECGRGAAGVLAPLHTAMERAHTLSALKLHCTIPHEWALKHPSDRPSAAEVLRCDLMPPRMEDEALNGGCLHTTNGGGGGSLSLPALLLNSHAATFPACTQPFLHGFPAGVSCVHSHDRRPSLTRVLPLRPPPPALRWGRAGILRAIQAPGDDSSSSTSSSAVYDRVLAAIFARLPATPPSSAPTPPPVRTLHGGAGEEEEWERGAVQWTGAREAFMAGRAAGGAGGGRTGLAALTALRHSTHLRPLGRRHTDFDIVGGTPVLADAEAIK
ncbi:unnamed protein product, partial [Closterium sp. NIES-64]